MLGQRTARPDLSRLIGQIAAAEPSREATDPLALARQLSGGRVLNVYAPGARPVLDDDLNACVTLVDDPEDADVSLVLHTPGVAAETTAALAEEQITAGRRVVLVDASQPDGERADPELLLALASTTVYVSNLAAYDVDLRRAIAATLVPLRDGIAHRRYLAETMLFYWAWRGIVEFEVLRSFGDHVPDEKMLRATTQAKSRLGAYLLKLRARGLRYFIRQVGFEGGRVDGLWVDLRPEGS